MKIKIRVNMAHQFTNTPIQNIRNVLLQKGYRLKILLSSEKNRLMKRFENNNSAVGCSRKMYIKTHEAIKTKEYYRIITRFNDQVK